MAETKAATTKKPTAAAQIKALEERVTQLETYIRVFDNFLTNTMISNTVDHSANETLAEIAAEIN